ncbi:MAG: transcriptional repressor [Chloroflexi bacterium]|nr:transcriptional repressor [Chloroflexota bacterium]MBP8059324.1 transcriptional repressor [Chloroflexota bacterium]
MPHYQLNYLQQIRERGYRLTPQRELILDTLCTMNGHATVNQIYERVRAQAPAVNRATIYRTLDFFHQLQMVSESQINGTTVYEIVQENPHHHMVCRHCGQVTVLDNHHFLSLAEHLLGEHGFKAEMEHLTIPGICSHCLAVTTKE